MRRPLEHLLALVAVTGVLGGEEKAPSLRDPPDASAVKAAEAAVKKLLEADYAAAKKGPAERQALARKLLKYGSEEKANDGQCFVCLREARDTAARAGDWKTAVEAIDALAGSFRVDDLEMRRAALDAARRAVRDREAMAELALAYPSLVDAALAADRHDLAARLAADFATAAERTRLERLVEEASGLKKEARDVKSEYDRIEKERNDVAAGRADPATRLVVGKFLCLMKGDWEKGLPLLAGGSEATFNSLGRRELEKPEEPPAQAEIGERWWSAAAEAEAGPLKVRMQRRAAEWCEKALPRLEGLARARAEKLIADYEDAALAAGLAARGAYLSDLKEEDYSVGHGKLGKNGAIGYPMPGVPGAKVLVNGKERLRSLSLHPPEKGKAYIIYNLGGTYRTLVGEVALLDGNGTAPRTPLVFKVVGDGSVLWTSTPIGKLGMVQKVKVRVAGVRRLALEIHCSGSSHFACGLWVDPQVLRG
jgi:hypothetical protein